MINWYIIAIIAAPIIALFIGAALDRALERRSRLIAYYLHVSSFRTSGEKPLDVFSHSIIIRNAGRKSASNVRIGHKNLPDFQIYPSISYEISDLPDGSKEICIPTFVPGEEISISYLYCPPITWQVVNTYIKSDEGSAKKVDMLYTRKLPKWANIIVVILLFMGATATIYLLILFIESLIGIF